MRTATMNMSEVKVRAEFANIKAEVYDRGDYVEVKFDAHGKTVCEAIRCMRNMINLIRCPFKLSVIHGFHNGQAIMTAIRAEFCSTRINRLYTDFWNPGITHFWVDGDSYILSYSA